MKLKRLTFAIVMFVIIAVVFALGGGTRIELWNPDSPITVMITDTTIDYKTGLVTDGDSGAVIVRVDNANFRGFEGGTGAGQAIWFDTALIKDAGRPTTGDSNATAITAALETWLTTLAKLDTTRGSMVMTFDTTGHTRITRTVSTIDSDTALTLATAVSHKVVGWFDTLWLYHDTIKTTLDSAWAAKQDTVSTADASTHELTGWTYKVWRGGNVTDTVWTGEPMLVPLADWYQWRPIVYGIKTAGTYNRDSIYVSIALQSRLGEHDYSPWVTLKTVTANDTTLNATNWVNLRRFPPDTDTGLTTHTYGHIGDWMRTVVTVTDSNSLPAAYGTIHRIDIISDLIVIQ